MTACEKIVGRKRQVCAGDLDRLITLQIRNIEAPVFDAVDYSMAFTTINDLWAMVETKKGTTIFDGTNIERIVDATFYIPFIPDITAESWILFEGIRYDIIRVEDLDLRHDYLALYTTTRGIDTNSVNAQ